MVDTPFALVHPGFRKNNYVPKNLYFCVLSCNLLYRSSEVYRKSRHCSSCLQLRTCRIFFGALLPFFSVTNNYVMLSTIALTKRQKFSIVFYLLVLEQVHKSTASTGSATRVYIGWN